MQLEPLKAGVYKTAGPGASCRQRAKTPAALQRPGLRWAPIPRWLSPRDKPRPESFTQGRHPLPSTAVDMFCTTKQRRDSANLEDPDRFLVIPSLKGINNHKLVQSQPHSNPARCFPLKACLTHEVVAGTVVRRMRAPADAVRPAVHGLEAARVASDLEMATVSFRFGLHSPRSSSREVWNKGTNCFL